MVAAKERFPGPQGVALARRVVVGVADDDHRPSAGGGLANHRNGSRPAPPDAAGLELHVVVAGVKSSRPGLQERFVDAGLVRDREPSPALDAAGRSRAPPRGP